MTVFGVQLDVMGFGSTIIDAHGVHCAQRRDRQIKRVNYLNEILVCQLFVLHFLTLCYNLEEIQTMSNYIICHNLQW